MCLKMGIFPRVEWQFSMGDRIFFSGCSNMAIMSEYVRSVTALKPWLREATYMKQPWKKQVYGRCKPVHQKAVHQKPVHQSMMVFLGETLANEMGMGQNFRYPKIMDG